MYIHIYVLLNRTVPTLDQCMNMNTSYIENSIEHTCNDKNVKSE